MTGGVTEDGQLPLPRELRKQPGLVPGETLDIHSESGRRRRLNPQEYLTDVQGRLPAMKNHKVKDVLPSRWKPKEMARNS